MTENIDTQKPFNRRWLVIIFFVIIGVYIISSLIYYLQVKHAATTNSTYSTIVSPANTGWGEKFDFTSIITDNFPPVSIVMGSFLLVLILEIILIYRLMVTRQRTSRLSKILYSVLYQFFVLVIFFGLFIGGSIFTAEMLTNQAEEY